MRNRCVRVSWSALLLVVPLMLIGAIARQVAAQSQTTTQPQVTTQSEPCRGQIVNNRCVRLRATFFEEERRLRFGFTDFLDAALDGSDNAINPNIRNPGTFRSPPPLGTGGTFIGTIGGPGGTAFPGGRPLDR